MQVISNIYGSKASLIALGACHPATLDRALRAPGGFAWWYADWVAPNGDGAVLIGSFGLPFLPATRRDAVAASQPALSLATYRAGRPSFYLLQQFEPRPHEIGADVWRFGRSELRLEHRSGACAFQAKLDLDLPGGSSLRGEARVVGPSLKLPAPSGGEPHWWSPIAPLAEGHLKLGGEHIRGRAYLDANCSVAPLPALGIADWQWGRLAFPDHELVYYLCAPQATGVPVRMALRVEADGTWRLHDQVVCGGLGGRRSVFGLDHHRTLRLTSADGLDVTIEQRHLVDDGPFYLRFLTEGRDERTGAVARGTAEHVVVGRVDVRWQRPFVRMRRHHVGGGNSMWLPLFSGPRRGRIRRLVRHWWQGAR